MLNDSLAAALSKTLNASRIGKSEVLINPVSKQIREVFAILKEEGFVGDEEKVKDARGGIYQLHLLGSINECGVIKPRYSVTLEEYTKFEKRYLIGINFGVLIVSTSKGMMTHIKAKALGLGGVLIAYCY